MAAYAALNSIMFILQQIQQHPRPPITIEKQHMESLCEIVSFLQDFLENYSHKGDIGDAKEALESRIADAAYAAEDVIESHIVYQILSKSNIIESHVVDQILSKSNIIESHVVDQFLAKSNIIESHVVDQILAKSNFHEQNYFINLFCSGIKKMIRTIACSRSHKTNQILTGDGERRSNSLFCHLQKVIKNMNLIKKEVMEIQEKIKGTNDDELPRNIISLSSNITGSSTLPPPKRKNSNTNTMVGFDDVLIEIMDWLTGHPRNRQILPIVGMGGIGKTTLARNVYENPFIVQHFHIRVWITIAQVYRLRDILIETLSFVDKSYEINEKMDDDKLGGQLYKSLCGRRYLIILDDVWSIEAWEELMLFFPDNNNGSRIMMTTRLSNMSNHFGSRGLKMNFLDEDKSWELFSKIVFPQDQFCPPELEEIGKKIARNCKGLPLSIAVIGGLLAKSEKTQQQWEYVMKNLNSIINLEDEMHCLKILYLSYNQLPIHLKPCFLYMGVFPEDTEIAVCSVIRLWVAEGFLKPIAAKSLEEVAEEYLKNLIDRNLILVHVLGCSGKVKYCKIHDLLRDLCLREGQKDKFLRVSKMHDLENVQGMQRQRRISIHESTSKEMFECDTDRVLGVLPSASLARSLTCNLKGLLLRYRLCESHILLRVFNMEIKNEYFGGRYFLEDILKLVNSRYLYLRTRATSMFPSSIHLIWNLQTLIIESNGIGGIPPEIWEMSRLRHLKIIGRFSFICLPARPNEPLIHEGADDKFILRNLMTLSRVYLLKLSEEVIKGIPNIKKLSVFYNVFYDEIGEWWHNYCLNNLRLLNKLESLYIGCVMFPKWRSQNELQKNLAFPRSLKKLNLDGIHLHWEDTRTIGSLPHLQVLKLFNNSFDGGEWNPVEGEFLWLKFLLIEGSPDLAYWNANRTHFPCLERLVLSHLLHLEEIPSDIGQIPTLRYIELRNCIYSLVMSAKNVLDEQVELGNDDLRVRVVCENKAQMERLATHNFQVEDYDSNW